MGYRCIYEQTVFHNPLTRFSVIRVKTDDMESIDERLDLRHGLGLLLVRQIVLAHNGTMTIESVPQKGCQITLDFPIETF